MTVTLSNEQMEELGVDPFIFNNSGAVSFAEGGDKESLELTLYDGSVVPHWYWGNLAFDLSSMKMAKKRSPILYSHDVDQRIGYSTSENFDKKFIMNGKFLKNSEMANKIKTEMEEGFQFEASLRFDPSRSTIVYVKEGESTEVNGHKLKGPGAVVSNAVIMEGSVCVFGALKNTASKAFQLAKFVNNFSERLNNMGTENKTTELSIKELTIDNFKDHLPDLYGQVFAAGENAAKEKFEQLKKACGDNNELLVKCFAEGKTVADALQMRAEAAEARTNELAQQLQQSAQNNDTRPDSVNTEFNNQPEAQHKGGDANDKFNESEATDEQLKEHFNKTKALQEEFGEVDYYVNFIKQEKKGRVKILNNK